MKRRLRAVPLAMLALIMAFGATGCNKLRARDQLNKGVQSYKNGKYEDAIEHFKNAVAFDPDLGVARLYLATAYVGQYVPGVDTPENNRSASMAIEQYQKVLEANPGQQTKITALKGIASLYFNMKKFDEAKQYHHKVLEIDPNDPETYYSIGVIDWTQAYQPRQELRNKLGLKNDEPIKDTKKDKPCEDLKTKNQDVVNDGINMLTKAIDLRRDYDDAMAYLNLMYREKADIECDDPVQRQADLKTADDWVEKTMATKRAKAEKQSKQGGIVMEQQGGQQQ
jgi:tetratricopeptide (TPR) repeat protein